MVFCMFTKTYSLFGNHVSIAVSWWKFLFQGHVQLGLKTLRSETHSNRVVCAVVSMFFKGVWGIIRWYLTYHIKHIYIYYNLLGFHLKWQCQLPGDGSFLKSSSQASHQTLLTLLSRQWIDPIHSIIVSHTGSIQCLEEGNRIWYDVYNIVSQKILMTHFTPLLMVNYHYYNG